MTEDKRIIKTVVLNKDQFSEITPEGDLQNIIKECSQILDECGFDDHYDAINKGRANSEAYHFAGLAILHAKSALTKMDDKDASGAVFNAMRAVHYDNLAVMRHTTLERDLWAGHKSRTGALLTSKFKQDELLALRAEHVARLRQEGKDESIIPRYIARAEGNYASAGLVPKYKVDNIRKYLQDHKLIKKKRH